MEVILHLSPLRSALPIGAAVLAAAVVSACARSAKVGDTTTASGATSERACFYPQQVTNFRDNTLTRSVYLRVNRAETYQLQTSGLCRELDTALRLAIVPEGGGRVCAGDWASIVVGTSTAETCRVQVVKRLTEAELAALPSRDRP